MLWFFEREDESLNLETKYDNDTSECLVIVRYADGRDHVQRFSDREEFGARLQVFEKNLELQHWRAQSGPLILPYGWPKKRLT